MKQPRIPVHIEGAPFILLSAFTAIIFGLVDCSTMAMFGLGATIFSTYFFRDPSRVVPQVPDALICPADGKVIRIEDIDDDRFLHQRVKKISIFMNVFNVHVNRLPLAGTIQTIQFMPGQFYAADKDKAVLHNEQCAMVVEAENQTKYCVVQIAGLIARRIVCHAEPGDTLKAGDRYGLIRFGSRVDLYLPQDCQINVQLGEKVKAGETVLGNIHKNV